MLEILKHDKILQGICISVPHSQILGDSSPTRELCPWSNVTRPLLTLYIVFDYQFTILIIYQSSVFSERELFASSVRL